MAVLGLRVWMPLSVRKVSLFSLKSALATLRLYPYFIAFIAGLLVSPCAYPKEFPFGFAL